MNLNGTAALRHVLAHILHQSQSRFLLVSYLDDTHAIFLLNAQILQSFAHDIHLLAILVEGGRRAAARHDVAMQIIEQLIFVYQVIKRFALLLFLSALLFAKEDFAERHEHDDADGDDDDAHREEAEEGKRLITALGQYFIDNQVGRRTDESKHSTQTSGKGERHEETRRLHARARSYAHDDRHHEGHRSGIAHEGADKGGYEHYEQEGDGFVAARERHELIARKLGKSGLHDSSTHHEESYHHDDDGRREARQRLGRCQDTQNQECSQGGKCHDVDPHPAPDE